jgi:dihydrofolate synthase/folylpolyglutamate synthase
VGAEAIEYFDCYGPLSLPLPALKGTHQADNAALAVAMLRHQDQVKVSPEAMAQGIREARWPARLQLLGPGPLTAMLPGRRVWLDGGHNADCARAIAAAMADRAPFDLVFGLGRNRRIADVLGPLTPLVRKARTVPIPGHDHHDPRDIAMVAQGGMGPRETNPDFTLQQALERLAADPDGRPDVLIAGSLYLAGEVLRLNRELPD